MTDRDPFGLFLEQRQRDANRRLAIYAAQCAAIMIGLLAITLWGCL